MRRTSLGLVAILAAVPACADSVSQPGTDAADPVDAVQRPDAPPPPDAPPIVYTPHRIDFDELPRGAAVTNQYEPEAVFAAVSGSVVVKADFNLGTSVPNYICGTANCDTQFSLTFGAPVRNLKLVACGSDSAGVVATIVVHPMNGPTHQRQVFGSNVFTQPIPVDLSATADIVKIEILNGNDGGGVAWDDIEFEYREGSPPIP